MIIMQYQVGNRRNSSPTLEVGVFFLEKDKKAIIVKESRGTQESTNSEGKWEKKLITEDLRMALEDGCFFE